MKVFMSAVFVIIFSLIFAQKKVEYWDNGEMKSQGNFKNGFKVGEWKFFFYNGALYQQGEYYVAEHADTFLIVDPKTKMESVKIVHQEEDLKTGRWVEYDKDGTLLRETFYHKGQFFGENKYY